MGVLVRQYSVAGLRCRHSPTQRIASACRQNLITGGLLIISLSPTIALHATRASNLGGLAIAPDGWKDRLDRAPPKRFRCKMRIGTALGKGSETVLPSAAPLEKVAREHIEMLTLLPGSHLVMTVRETSDHGGIVFQADIVMLLVVK